MLFLWSNYGAVTLYKLDTLEQCKKLYKNIAEEIEFFGDADFNNFMSSIEEPTSISEYIYAIDKIIVYIKSSNLEYFVHNTGFYTPKG